MRRLGDVQRVHRRQQLSRELYSIWPTKVIQFGSREVEQTMQPAPSIVHLPILRAVIRIASASIDDDIFAVVRAILQVGNNLLLPASNLAAACFGLDSGLRLGEIPQAQDTARRRLPPVACPDISKISRAACGERGGRRGK